MSQEVFKLLCPFQIRWLQEPAGVAIAEKSRRIGWTWTHALKIVLDLAGRTAATKRSYYHSSADDTASREFVDYCADWARMVNAVAQVRDETETIGEREIRTKVMEFKNGSKIVAGSSNPTFLRSKGGEVGLDEFAFHRDGRELVKAAHATARFWGYPLRIWSTHNGDGSYFNGMIKAARGGQLKAAVHRVTILDAVEDGIHERIVMRKKRLADVPAPDAGARRAWLEELRSECPDEATWQEEYMCDPQSEANALLTYELIRGCERSSEDLVVVEDPRELKFNGPMYAGFDVGRQRDLTVFWVLAKVGDVFETRLLKTFKKTPYDTQEAFLNLLMQQNVRRICVDSTGIGDMLAERARQRWGYRAEGVKFTPDSKAGMAMPLVRLFEDKLVRVPADAGIREGLHKVRKIVTSAGNVRFDAKHDESGHADEFWALALAYHAADDLKLPRRMPLDDKPEVLI
jgi:phage FluMu gp28-like protein